MIEFYHILDEEFWEYPIESNFITSISYAEWEGIRTYRTIAQNSDINLTTPGDTRIPSDRIALASSLFEKYLKSITQYDNNMNKKDHLVSRMRSAFESARQRNSGLILYDD